jgi:catechol-2,3-dioxygenase
MNKSDHPIKGLGEVSLRVTDLAAMHKFYEEVVGLEVLRQDESFVFFKVAQGLFGHPQVFAIFDATNRGFIENKSEQLDPDQSTFHHVAFNIALGDFTSEKRRLESLGVKVLATEHEWLHVRSQYFSDPEGNLVEFVAYDESV